MFLNSFIGNENTVYNLKQSLENRKFMHSILICGEDGTGVNYLARCLAADFLYPYNEKDDTAKVKEGALQVMQNKNPEYIVLSGTGANGDIPVDAIRAVRKSIYGTSLSAAGRVVHIKHAQNLNAFSANALLKILEEPPQNVLFILTASAQNTIMPTLLSRCAVYNLSGATAEQCALYLQNEFKNEENIKQKSIELSNIFSGKIGLCIYCLLSQDGINAIEDSKNILKAFFINDTYTAMCIVLKYETDKKLAQKFFDILIQLAAYYLRNTNFVQTTQNEKQIAAGVIKQASNTKILLAKNVNIKMALTCFCVNAIN